MGRTTGSSLQSYNFTYDNFGNMTKLQVGSRTLAEYTYSSKNGQLNQQTYGYDSESRLKSINYSIPGVVDNATETFYYNTSTTDSISDGALEKMALFSNEWITYSYDSLSRLSSRTVGNILTERQTYLPGSGTCTTTTLPETFYTTAKGSSAKLSGFRYAYNEVGNVTQITNLVDGIYQKFAYDKLGQMQYVTDYGKDGTAQQRYKYYYDNAGNLTSWKIQDGTGSIIGVEHTYTYGDSNWKDLLTAFDGQSITYDGSGNPLSYYNGKRYTMTWRNGRELNSVTVGGKTYSYEYDVNGLRTRKTNADGGYTEYYIVDGLTVAEQRFTSSGAERYTLRYLYDESSSPVGFGIQYPGETTWKNYYFAKNLQGDVIALYRWDGLNNGVLVATYKYDPWGKPLGIYNASGSSISQTASNVAAYNPFRYRGYRYDADTGFYYLQSRYYDPAICRFINADEYSDTDDGLLGFNMFAYCLNNPMNRSDPNGSWSLPNWAKVAIGAVATVAAVAVTVATGGAAAPVLIGVASSTIGGAATNAIKHRVTTGSWKGAGKAALDGAANGFMTGGLSALGGSVIGGAVRTVKNARAGITIGKMGSFDKVAELANTRHYSGLKEFNLINKVIGPKAAEAVGWWQNKCVVKGVMALKGAIYDCGGALTGAYAKEVALTKGYQYLYNVWLM